MRFAGRVALVFLVIDLLAGLLLGHWVEALLRWEFVQLHSELHP